MLDVYCKETQQQWPFTVLVVTRAPHESGRTTPAMSPKSDSFSRVETPKSFMDTEDDPTIEQYDILLKFDGLLVPRCGTIDIQSVRR